MSRNKKDRQEPPDIGHEREVEAAYMDSHNHKLGDIELEPYSPMRQTAADAMGLVYGRMDDAAAAQFQRNQLYPGAVRDVAIVLWLCTLKDDLDDNKNVVLSAKAKIDSAARDPITAAEQSQEWAADMGILRPQDDEFWEAYKLFFKILMEVRASRVVAKKKTGAT